MGTTLDYLKRLNDHAVEFVVVGGFAGIAHGSNTPTEDIDFCIPFDLPNITKIVATMSDLNPRWRMSPSRPPMPLDPQLLSTYKNMYITCDWGQIDFLSEITGLGEYARVAMNAIQLTVAGQKCPVMSLDDLITAKRALGRPKDLQFAIEMEACRNRSKTSN